QTVREFRWRLSPESRYAPFYRRRRREESHSEKSAIRNRQSEIEMSLVTSTPTKAGVLVMVY
ncbi:MAG: hypothetical protein ACLQPI_04295, partial [Limisphaerales bacterium]